MTLEGTVVNGAIVLDGAPALPEGARVRVELAGAEGPHANETREEYLAGLRGSVVEAKAGGGVDARVFLKELALRHNLPLQPGE